MSLCSKKLNTPVKNLDRSSVFADELTMCVLPDVLHRDVTVHVAFAWPQTFSPVSVSNVFPPIQLVFYDGMCGVVVHYKMIAFPHDLFSGDINGELR